VKKSEFTEILGEVLSSRFITRDKSMHEREIKARQHLITDTIECYRNQRTVINFFEINVLVVVIRRFGNLRANSIFPPKKVLNYYF